MSTFTVALATATAALLQANGCLPFAQPLALTVSTPNLAAAQTIAMSCWKNGETANSMLQAPTAAFTDVGNAESHDFTVLAQSAATDVLCAWNSDVAGNGWDPVAQRLAFRVCGPDASDQLGGSQNSLVIGTETKLDLNAPLAYGAVSGLTFEVWFRCAVSTFLPVYSGDTYTTPAIPTGVFFARQADVATNPTLINSEFSHSATMMCGTAPRQSPTTGAGATTTRFCTTEYASTTGTWVHGAMTWDAPSGQMLFYLNGVAQTNSLVPAGIVEQPGWIVSPGEATLNVFYSFTSAATSYLAAGTAVDNMRAWHVLRTGAEISSSYNTALVGTEASLLTTLHFYAAAAFDSSKVPGWVTATLSGGAPTYVSATNCDPFRSCSRGGCAPPGLTAAAFDVPNPAVDPVCSSSTAEADSSSAAGSMDSSSGAIDAASSSGAVDAASSSTAAMESSSAATEAQSSSAANAVASSSASNAAASSTAPNIAAASSSGPVASASSSGSNLPAASSSTGSAAGVGSSTGVTRPCPWGRLSGAHDWMDDPLGAGCLRSQNGALESQRIDLPHQAASFSPSFLFCLSSYSLVSSSPLAQIRAVCSSLFPLPLCMLRVSLVARQTCACATGLQAPTSSPSSSSSLLRLCLCV